MDDVTTVFVYGTLTDDDLVGRLLDDWSLSGPAVIEGLTRVAGTYPTLVPGGRVEGRLLETTELDRLDEYEGVGEGPYVRVTVRGPRGEGWASTWPRPDPSARSGRGPGPVPSGTGSSPTLRPTGSGSAASTGSVSPGALEGVV